MSYLKKINLFWVVIIFLAVLPSLYGVWHSGFFVSDDGNWMVIRFSAFYQALADGQFPVRFLDRLNYSYGYPVANFLYPGFMYIGVPLKIVGFDSLQVFKILVSLFMMGGAVFSFFWLKNYFSPLASYIGALVYTYSPYHLYNLYKRGSVGELMSLSIVPFILWMIERKSVVFTALGYFFLLVSHNTLALLFTLFILGYASVRKRLKWTAAPLAIGAMMSSFFTIPSLLELKYTQFSTTEISDPIEHFASFSLVGLGSVVILIATIITLILVFVKKRIAEKKYLAVFSVVFSMILIFFTISLSGFVWEMLPSSWIQFPFRLLSVTLVSISFLAAYVVYTFLPRVRIVVGGIIILIVLVFSDRYLFPEQYSHHDIGFYETNESLTTTHSEYMPITVKKFQTSRPVEWVEKHEGEIEIKNITKNSHKIQFDVVAETNGSVKVNRIYFPGWNYQINDDRKKIPFTEDDGLMYIPIFKGDQSVRVSFDETPVRSVANFISILGGLILLMIPAKKIINAVFK